MEKLVNFSTIAADNRGIAVIFLDLGTRMWCEVSVTPRPLFIPEKDSVPIVQEAG
jgi:hypothetical protein